VLDDRELQKELGEVSRRGEANAEVIRLARNWCRHLEVDRSRFSGVGIPEQMTGLPIAPREFKCPHAKRPTSGHMRAEAAALEFYDNNCVDCEYREPVALPNLLSLVHAREEEQRKREKARAAAEEARRVAFQARQARREAVIEHVDAAQEGLVKLIRALDEDPDTGKAHRLIEAAIAAPHRFSDELRDLLYDLVAAGGNARIDGALGALDAVEPDRASLASVTCSVLASGSGTREAVQLAGRLMPHVGSVDIGDSLASIVNLATPSPPPLMVASPAPAPDPRPLLAAFQQHRGTVVDYLVRALRGGSSWERRDAAHAAKILFGIDASLVRQLTPDLVRSVLLPDDRSAYPRSAAEEAICAGLRQSPLEVDEILRAALSNTDVQGRALLFGIIERFLRFSDGEPEQPALEVCVQHLVEALSVPDETERLSEAARAIERISREHPNVVGRHAVHLLGAAALLAVRIDAKPEEHTLETISPAEFKALEAMNRRQAQARALREIVAALSRMAPEDPDGIGALVVDTLGGLGEEHDRFRAELVRGMGEMATRSRGLRMALPGLYLGLMHESTLVRAAAAEAYGKTTRRFAEDLPDLAHEAFLLLLQDPYVIVHKSAVRALERGGVAETFRKRFAGLVGQLVVIYRQSRQDDGFLAKALDVFCRLNRPEEMTAETTSYLLDTLAEIGPNHSWDVLRFLQRRFEEHPKYADAVLCLLSNPETYGFYLSDISKQLREIPEREVSRIAADVVRIAPEVRARAHGEGNPTLHLLAALGIADRWDQAQELLADWLRDDALRQWPESLAGVERMASAARIEAAVAAADAAALRQSLDAWERLLDEQGPGRPASSPFLPAFQLRVQGLAGLQRDDSGEEEDNPHVELGEKIAHLAEHIDGIPGDRYRAFGGLLSAYGMLRQWRRAVRAAEADATRFLRAAKHRASEVRHRFGTGRSSVGLARIASLIEGIVEPSEVSSVLSSLLSCSLPLPLSRRRRLGGPPVERERSAADRETEHSPVAVVSFDVDGEPLESGMVIHPNVVHDLGVSMDLSRWIEDARELVVYPVSVEPPDVFQLPVFKIQAPAPTALANLADRGRLLLKVAQTVRSRPLEFVYRATMITADGREIPVHVEGQRRFEVRSYDPSSQPVTGNPELDTRLLDIAGQLRRVRNLSASDREHFLLLMTEFGRIAGESVASNTFASPAWDESRWQDWVWGELRKNPSIGSELEKHPHIAAGITDLSFHRVRIELKAESERFVTVEHALSFTEQTAQYVAGSQKRVGVLAILDVSPKDVAPGAVGNSLHLHLVRDPGGGTYPIAVGVVIVRGNLARPSDLSRRFRRTRSSK